MPSESEENKDEKDVAEEEIELSRFQKIKENIFSTKTLIKAISVFVLLFIVMIIYQSCAPKKGNILYGICSAFLEMQLPFPETIKLKEIEFYRKGLRMHYTHLDGFGEYLLESIECSFEQDPQKGVQLESVFFNYVKESTHKERIQGKGRLYAVKQEEIDLFNNSLSPAAVLLDNELIIPKGTITRYY